MPCQRQRETCGVTTLRVTSAGNLLPNFFALVTATADLPILSGMYPDGAHPLEYQYSPVSLSVLDKNFLTFPPTASN